MIGIIAFNRRPSLVIISSVLFLLAGCDESIENGVDPCHSYPVVEYMSVAFGGEVPSNAGIVVEFNMPVDSVEINVSDATGFTYIDGGARKRAVWMPISDMVLGSHEVVIDASQGQCELKGFTSFHFTAVNLDKTPPGIDDAKCDPINGATDVNPFTYVRYLQVCDYVEETWLRIVFTEPMLAARIIAINPALDLVQQMSGGALLFAFLEQEIPYDTEFEITLSGIDLAGNELATTEYSFTTIKKEN